MVFSACFWTSVPINMTNDQGLWESEPSNIRRASDWLPLGKRLMQSKEEGTGRSLQHADWWVEVLFKINWVGLCLGHKSLRFYHSMLL